VSRRRTTSADVAKLAGVSRSAVSLVLNGHARGNIAAETQARILSAAKKLEYTPNSVAVSLRNRRTSTIGVVTDEIATSPFAGRILRGALDHAWSRGFLLLVVDTQYSAPREAALVGALRARQVDGMMYAAMSMRGLRLPAAMREVPSTLANCYSTGEPAGAVIPDERAGGRHAAELPLEQGHRRIVMLAGTKGVPAATLRIKGFHDALGAAGIAERDREVIRAGWHIDDGFGAALEVLERRDRPTALVCANDRVATGVVLAATRLGLRVPEDVSVVGYDDQEELAEQIRPALTTIALPHETLGVEAMRLLLDHLESGAPLPPGRVLIPCRPVIRDSVGPVPAR
jgi:LacI family transcriptional regulator